MVLHSAVQTRAPEPADAGCQGGHPHPAGQLADAEGGEGGGRVGVVGFVEWWEFVEADAEGWGGGGGCCARRPEGLR